MGKKSRGIKKPVHKMPVMPVKPVHKKSEKPVLEDTVHKKPVLEDTVQKTHDNATMTPCNPYYDKEHHSIESLLPTAKKEDDGFSCAPTSPPFSP